STRADQSPVIKDAALIANFYGKRGQMQDLIECLVQSLTLTPQGHNSYANTATGALLRHFDPPAASTQDTTIIQMALNTSGVVEAAWQAMRQQLEAILPNDELLKHVWGYTLIYQAELTQDVVPNDAFAALLPIARPLH